MKQDNTLPPKVTILHGGIGPERDVSLASGKALAEALQLHYPVDLLDLNKAELPPELDPHETVIFSVIHGTFGEDGSLQKMLENKGFAYAGSDSAASLLCMNKGKAKQVVGEMGVRGAEDFYFQDPSAVEPAEIVASLGADVILKPTDQGSSVALFVLHGEDELRDALAKLSPGNWMIERRIMGREFTVGVLGDMAMGIVEVIPQGGVYDYDRKYTPGSTEYKFPAILPLHLEEKIKQLAMQSFSACGCRDFARVDFIVCADGHPHFLEINTLPGLTATSLLPKSASCSGYDFPGLVKRLVTPAIERFSQLSLQPAA